MRQNLWLRQSPLKPNSRYMREHIERLKVFQSLALPDGLGHQIHQNRLLKMAREGAQMTPRDLAKFADERRYATLAALAIEGMATVTDELVDLHDRIMIKLFSAAKNKHQQDFQQQGKAINDKVRLYSRIGRALVNAKESGTDPYAAIEAVLPWTDFTRSVTEAAELASTRRSTTCTWWESSTAPCGAIRPSFWTCSGVKLRRRRKRCWTRSTSCAR